MESSGGRAAQAQQGLAALSVDHHALVAGMCEVEAWAGPRIVGKYGQAPTAQQLLQTESLKGAIIPREGEHASSTH